jgi:hypothetical protein
VSLQRHRLLQLYLRDRTNVFNTRQRLLRFAPEPQLRKTFAAVPILEYVTTDFAETSDIRSVSTSSYSCSSPVQLGSHCVPDRTRAPANDELAKHANAIGV